MASTEQRLHRVNFKFRYTHFFGPVSRFLPHTVLFFLTLAFFATENVRAAAFVPFGSTWKLLDDGSNQSNAWRSIDYEDDGWASGPAQLGYGDGDEATEVSYGTNAGDKYITTYFRQTFNVSDVKPPGLAPNQGAVYVVAGRAGKISGGSLDHSAMFLSLNRLGSLYFEVNGDRLDATFLRENGTTNDSFAIIKGNTITVADVNVLEPDTSNVNAVFTLTLAQTSAVPVTVSYAAASETALAGLDFGAASGSVTFDAGVLMQTVIVAVLGDLLVQPDETFALNFSGTPLLTHSLARGTILNNDSTSIVVAPTFSSVNRSNQVLHLQWLTMDGLTYRVEYKDDLSDVHWQIFQPAINGDGSIYTFIDTTTTNVPQRFYRVSVE